MLTEVSTKHNYHDRAARAAAADVWVHRKGNLTREDWKVMRHEFRLKCPYLNLARPDNLSSSGARRARHGTRSTSSRKPGQSRSVMTTPRGRQRRLSKLAKTGSTSPASGRLLRLAPVMPSSRAWWIAGALQGPSSSASSKWIPILPGRRSS